MSQYSLHFDPWNIRASDLADVMYRMKKVFRENTWYRYREGTSKDDDNIMIEYDDGNILFWLDYVEYEDVPRMLAMLSPYDMRLVEVYSLDSETGASAHFDIYQLNHEFGKMVRKANEYMKETNDELMAYERVWEEFCKEHELDCKDEEEEDEEDAE